MAWWRHNRLVRTVVMALLLWTAADLTNASLCALDSDVPRAFAMASDATLQDADGRHAPTPTPLQHIDDCFCCSHCVNVHALSLFTVTTPIYQQHPAAALAGPLTFGAPLYHPPLV